MKSFISTITALLGCFIGSYAQQIQYEPLLKQSDLAARELNLELAVGKTAASHGVSQTGAFTYQVPIHIPVGTNGMQPQVSIAYSSQGGSGTVGFGWNITGLSMISRVNKTHFHDGEVKNVMLQYDDAIELDGNRLILMEGDYGHDGSIYKTDLETFVKVTLHGNYGNGADWFEVETKNGFILEYGRNSNAQVLSHNSSEVIAWQINRKIDRHGNYIDYQYQNLNGEDLISRISYTGNLQNDQAPYAHINFLYKERTDENIYYATEYGKVIKKKYLLNDIDITYGSNADSYKRYEFKYGYNFYSYLNEIIEYGKMGSQDHFNTLQFSYHNAGQNYSEIQTSLNSGAYDYFPGDFNGDGKTDLLRASRTINGSVKDYSSYQIIFNTATGFSVPISFSAPTGHVLQKGLNTALTVENGILYFDVGDFNGDGKTDIACLTGGKTPNNMHMSGISIYYSSCIGASSNFTQTNYNVPSVNNLGQRNVVLKGDFDGDGAMDLYFNLNNGHKRDYGVHEDNLYAPVILAPNRSSNPFPVTNISQELSRKISYLDIIYTLDMNGNGKTEIMQVREHRSYNHTLVREFEFDNGTANTNQILLDNAGSNLHGNIASKGHAVEFGDFNGDGKTDIMTAPKWDKTTWTIQLSTGREFINPQAYDLWLNPYEDQLRVADLNGDGKSDFFITREKSITANTKVDIHYSKGIGANGFIHFDFRTETFSERITGVQPAYLIDYDGDGFLEMMGCWTISDDFIIGDFDAGYKFGQLGSISSGFNELTKVNYASISTEDECRGLYTPEHTAIYPIIDFHKPIHVTAAISFPDGSGLNGKEINRIVNKYYYQHAKLHLQGKGFLGFEKVEYDQYYLGSNNNTIILNHSEYEIDNKYFFSRLIKTHKSIVAYDNFLPNDPNGLQCISARSFLENIFSQELAYSTLSLPNNRFINQLNQVRSGDNLVGNTTDEYYEYNALNSSLNGNPDVIRIIKALGTANQEEQEVLLEYGQFGTHIPAHPVRKETILTRGINNSYTQIGEYDYSMLNGNMIAKRVINPISLSVDLQESYTYDAHFGLLLTTEVDVKNHAGGALRKYTQLFDNLGRFIIRSTNPYDYTKNWTYDQLTGLKVTYDDELANNNLSSFNYDDFHRLERTVDEFGNTTIINRYFDVLLSGQGDPDKALFAIETISNGFGDKKIWHDHLGNARKTESDGLGQKKYIFSNLNERGQSVIEFQPHFNGQLKNRINYTYDKYGRLEIQTLNDPNGTILTTNINSNPAHTGIVNPYNYINRNIVFTAVRADGVSISKTIDPTGKTRISQDNGGAVEFAYFSNGSIKNTKVNGVETSSVKYDEYGYQTELNEMNSGRTTYRYNVIGELISQTDARNNSTNYVYDKMGRNIQMTSPEADYTFDFVNGNTKDGLGNISSAIVKTHSPAVYQNEVNYEYNSDGNLILEEELIAGAPTTFKTRYEYDSKGRLLTKENNAGFKKFHRYTSNGFLHSIHEDGTAKVLFRGGAQNEMDQWTQYTLMGQPTTIKTYNEMYRLESIRTSGLYERDYTFDNINSNLSSRTNVLTGMIESFQYDNLDRLEEVKLNGITSMNLSFGLNGSIESKTDNGKYSYHPTKKHAVIDVDNSNGTIHTSEQHIEYNSDHKPEVIIENGIEWRFQYGPFNQRKRAEIMDQNSGVTKYKYYTNGVEYEYNQSGDLLSRVEYIGGLDGLCAMRVDGINFSNGPEIYLVHQDHLGSIDLITDVSQNKIAEQSFDAWGRYRNPSNWTTSPGFKANIPDWLSRGYTGHEHLEDFQLIHMNGRLYDPFLGRMLSPDNLVQFPLNTQNYNRYSYVMNNPLKYTDPSGDAILTAIIVGAVIGGYSGGVIANGTYNLSHWNYQSNNTWSYIAGGVLVGAASAAVGFSVANSGMAFANTASIIVGSYINSVGMAAITGGQTSLTVGFGAGSYNITQGKFGYLSKKGNSSLENIGYGLGALANLNDFVTLGIKQANYDLYTDNDDNISHTALIPKNSSDQSLSFGPNDSKTPQRLSGFAFKVRKGTADYPLHDSSPLLNELTISKNIVSGYKKVVQLLPYQGCSINCVNIGSGALWLNGIPNIGIHPYLLRLSIKAYQSGLRFDLNSHYIHNR